MQYGKTDLLLLLLLSQPLLPGFSSGCGEWLYGELGLAGDSGSSGQVPHICTCFQVNREHPSRERELPPPLTLAEPGSPCSPARVGQEQLWSFQSLPSPIPGPDKDSSSSRGGTGRVGMEVLLRIEGKGGDAKKVGDSQSGCEKLLVVI